jgi:enamine deaminase RidA (YjgF/YER057c/UK114 family)
MTFERINPPDLAAPKGFSLAGQTALDASGKIVGADVVEQFEKALTNFLRALEAAGGTPADLVTITIYIVDVDAYLARAREIGGVWRRLAGTDYPAAAGIGVARLWDAEALVEIQGIAALE